MFARLHDLLSPWTTLQAWSDAAQEWSQFRGCDCLMLEAFAATAPDVLDDQMLSRFLPVPQLCRRRLRSKLYNVGLTSVYSRRGSTSFYYDRGLLPAEKALKKAWFDWHYRHQLAAPFTRREGYLVAIDLMRELCALLAFRNVWVKAGIQLTIPKSAGSLRNLTAEARQPTLKIFPRYAPWLSGDPFLRIWARDATAVARSNLEQVTGRHFARTLGVTPWIGVFVHRRLRTEGHTATEFLDKPILRSSGQSGWKRKSSHQLEQVFLRCVSIVQEKSNHLSVVSSRITYEWALLCAFLEQREDDFLLGCKQLKVPLHIVGEVVSDLDPAYAAREFLDGDLGLEGKDSWLESR